MEFQMKSCRKQIQRELFLLDKIISKNFKELIRKKVSRLCHLMQSYTDILNKLLQRSNKRAEARASIQVQNCLENMYIFKESRA